MTTNNSCDLIKFGYGKRDITPSLGHPITGYYEPRNVKGVIDPLFVRTVLFDNGANRAVLVSMDHIGLDKDLCTLIRERIGKAVSVHPDAVFITSGIIVPREDDVLAAFAENGLEVIARHESGGES